MRVSNRPPLSMAIFVVLLVAIASAASSATPEGVSPGAVDRVVAIRGECPTFSWGQIAGAHFYEVLVYELPKEADLQANLELSAYNEVLYTKVIGSATSWTPGLDRCFVPGSSYVWFVRAVENENGVSESREWSDGRFFSVAIAPSTEQVRRALAILNRFIEHEGSEPEEWDFVVSDAGAPTQVGRQNQQASSNLTKAALSGGAAIRGEMPDLTGETYGIYGITNSGADGSLGVVGEATAATGEVFGLAGITSSPNGAGILAVNIGGGSDLELDGSADGVTSTELSESGVDRSSGAPEAFSFVNSGGGGMTLDIDGVDVVTTTTDQDTVASLSCASGEVAKWDGAAWGCAPDDDTTIWQTNSGRVYTYSPVGIGTNNPQNSLSIGGSGDASFKATVKYNDYNIANLASAQVGVFGKGLTYGVHGSYQNTLHHGYLGASGAGVLGESTSLGVKGVGNTIGVKGENSQGDYGYLGYTNIGVYGVGIGTGVYGYTRRDATTPVALGTSRGVLAQVILDNASGGAMGVHSSIVGTTVNGTYYSGYFGSGGITGGGTYMGLAADLRTGDAVDIAELIYGAAEAGDVVVADPENPETVLPSSNPYDTSVVGIISTKPHLIMGMDIIRNSEGEFTEDIDIVKLAVSGRVPVKVTGSVSIGDLLTTSSVPGHAMKCDEISKCIGSIVGKALSENIDGKVVALVSLQ